ncbi:N-formylglutamate deformylase [Thermomonas carbonis]|uniref:N-formylglutamate deformylase n=1 Tax=Thermomonas carbonis TaxID=1463158 RepID=A0A7G9SME9_9GAMM|nr:N-formylglutamate deformylase [Thermomonas carbonis]QNN69024.1 N-formylglutamate deformylase [Thermomonas carbonis]GHC07253.1 N-formylglutamate deformylase [Thermomonas carbonis]
MSDVHSSEIFTLHRGTAPLLLSLPHDGSLITEALQARMTPRARVAPDTDWHVSRLYDFARDLGASILVPKYSRYVIDLNRGEDDTSLYPGQNTTGLVPLVRFTGEPIYLPGREPDADEVASRIDTYWRPYHAALRGELDRLRAAHGRVALWEGHSIRGSDLPFLFDGRLPDLNLGTANGASCSPALQARIEAELASQIDYGWVANGRFKGGHITRHYGTPAGGIDAVQLEISQRTYMDEDSFAYEQAKAAQLQPLLRALLVATLAP